MNSNLQRAYLPPPPAGRTLEDHIKSVVGIGTAAMKHVEFKDHPDGGQWIIWEPYPAKK